MLEFVQFKLGWHLKWRVNNSFQNAENMNSSVFCSLLNTFKKMLAACFESIECQV